MNHRRVWPIVAATIVSLVVLVAIFPTGTWLDQRAAHADAQKRLDVLTAETERLEQRLAVLQTDEEIERLARSQYNLVMPGEEAYAILPPKAPDVDLDVLRTVLEAATFWRP